MLSNRFKPIKHVKQLPVFSHSLLCVVACMWFTHASDDAVLSVVNVGFRVFGFTVLVLWFLAFRIQVYRVSLLSNLFQPVKYVKQIPVFSH